MTIGIDASRANLRNKTGVEWYGWHIIRELARLDTKNRYRLYSWEPLREDLADLPDNFENVEVPTRRAWPHTALSSELKREPVEALFVPSHVVPRVHPPKTVVTVHDLGFRQFRKNYSFYHYLSLQLGTRWSVKWASDVLVPSQAVADDVRRTYASPGRKVQVVPNGVDAAAFHQPAAQVIIDVLKRHRIADPYLLFLGRLEERKNVVRIIEAFYRLKDSGLFGGQLVLAGNPGEGYHDIKALIGKQRDRDDIIQPGYVADADRAALMFGARAFVFPSLFEGFGIPILEAFAAGTPVLTSNRGATAEIAGNAALLVDPENVTAIHQGIERLLSDTELTETLTARGAGRVQDFSWRKTAEHIHAILTA